MGSKPQLKRVKGLRPSVEFRQQWQYSNIMYMILSSLPTTLLPSKPSFAEYVKEHIFVPLGLNHTTYSFDVANATGLVADGLARDNPNLANDPLGKGTVRALPYQRGEGGEDGNSEKTRCF